MERRGAIDLNVNGVAHRLAVPHETPLLYVLRNDLGLNGPKFGCGLGECGACAILLDGVAARSCVIPAGIARGRAIVTLEGLGSPARPHPVQQAFIDEDAAQCGYCLNGMIVTATALLARQPDPSEAEIREALRYNLCRCGTHMEILRAVRRAAGRPGADLDHTDTPARQSPAGDSRQRHPESLAEKGAFRPRHAEERPQAASRSTPNPGASFETPGPGFAGARAPQDDAVGDLGPASKAGRYA